MLVAILISIVIIMLALLAVEICGRVVANKFDKLIERMTRR